MGCYVAIDIGAESGRILAGELKGGRLNIRETSRFSNGMLRMGGHLHWNVPRLFEEIVRGFSSIAAAGIIPDSIGVDTWGVDFALLAPDGSMLGLPVAYRDPRTDGMMEKFFKLVPRETIYSKTGVQFMQINTLYQLFAMVRAGSPLLAAAGDLLMMPDFLNYLFTGRKTMEFTNATTTQLLNVHTGSWDGELLEAAGIPSALFRPVVRPGTEIGPLLNEISNRTGLPPIPVIAPATHDTGSAVAAVPAEGSDFAYISSGTWSLMGIETRKPITSPGALKCNFTNEGGVNGTFRFLKNIMGLWLVQGIRAGFAEKYDYAELTKMASESQSFRSLIDVNDIRFLNPDSMPGAISAFCRRTGQPDPDSPGAFTRCALESLALEYRSVLEELKQLDAPPVSRIHIIGGGTKNKLLCRMAAEATGLPVFAGPAEATGIGNILVQAVSIGHLDSIGAAREVVRGSFDLEKYEPENTPAWNSAYEKFLELKEKK